MERLRIFLLLSFFLCIAFLLQSYNFLHIHGAQPNFLLLVMLGIMFFSGDAINTLSFFGLLLVMLCIHAIFFPFWIAGSIILIVLLGIMRIARNIFTGNAVFDFYIALVFLTIVLRVAFLIFLHSPWSVENLSIELLLNLILGSFLWISLERFK